MGVNSRHSYLKVKEQLRLSINNLAPGSKIKSRPELSKQLNTSRTTVERAISELIGEGYLYARDGSGTYVTEEAAQKGENQKVKNRNWGVILPDILQDTYPGILRGIEDEAILNNYNTIICNSDNNEKKQNMYVHKLIHSHAAGIIIVPAVIAGKETVKIFEEVTRAGIPMVFCNRGFPFFEVPRVLSNNFYGSYTAVRHLLSMGYQKIAFITRQWYTVSQERYEGYMAALTEADLVPNENYYVFDSGNPDVAPSEVILDETTVIKNLLSSSDPPDAVFCFNDSIAEKVFWEVKKQGKTPGVDFGIVGYDDTGICERLPVKLTSIKYKTYETGREAARLLQRMINGENVPLSKTVIFQPELVVRESSLKESTTSP
jgi:DNA-binding LacI/PurR family transcriptional regulator